MKQIAVTVLIAAALFSCTKKRDKDPKIIVPPSGGSAMQLNGGEGGTDAENSVYVDFSADKQTIVPRKSWDLGFFCGMDFSVVINNTTFAFAKVTDKTDINTVTSADAQGAILAFNHAAPPLLTSRVADDVNGDLSKTAIPAISATDVENKVVIINRGTNGGIGVRPYVKVRILRNGAGYTLQYAPLESTTFKTVQIVKNNEYHFVHINLDNGAIVTDFPKKADWDIQWGYSVQAFKTFFYGFSDVVAINHLSGVQAFEAVYADATAASNAFNQFNKDSVAKYNFSTDKWAIGSNWRVAGMSVTGVLKDRFYVVKDVAGNVYKLKFISFSEKDGGTRGKPQIRYDLIK